MSYSPDRYSEEKRDYFDESSSNGEHWADNANGAPGSTASHAQRQRPPLTVEIAPPRAAFIAEPRSGAASPSSVNFGDYSANGGNGKTRLRPESNVNWSRFSMAMHKEKQARGQKKEKTWLDKKASNSRRWIVLGYCAALLVFAIIGGLLAWHFIRPRTTTNPEIASLGGLDGNSVTDSSSASASTSATHANAVAAGTSESSTASSAASSSTASSTAATTAAEEAVATTTKAATTATSESSSASKSAKVASTSTEARRHRRHHDHGQ